MKRVPKHILYISDNTALIEGWAHYVESLMESDFQGSVLFRAVRLVVDTGIHYYGWTYENAYEYMKKYLGDVLPESDIHSEIKRYICIPGQALAYAMGKKIILEMREEYFKHNLGTIKDFHKFILEDGIVPFPTLKDKLVALKIEKRSRPYFA
jgi:uncharacterized protein (DUF885 family)